MLKGAIEQWRFRCRVAEWEWGRKQKFRNLLEENVMRLAKRCAAEEERPLKN